MNKNNVWTIVGVVVAVIVAWFVVSALFSVLWFIAKLAVVAVVAVLVYLVLRGVFSRQLFLGETLDTEQLSADYDAGVLTITIPVAEQAKPRKITITGSGGRQQISG